MYLFFDTETTGLIDFNSNLSAPHQPRVTQLSAILTNEEGQHLAEMNVRIKPDGWTVPEEITALNGTTTELCEREGIPMLQALAMFNAMKAACKARVAHNISFDKQMLAREALAYAVEHNSDGLQSLCTMQMSKPICQLPPSDKMMAAGIRGFKSPNLQEAHVHFFGEKFEGAHDALADVRACKAIFFKMKERERMAA